VRSALLRIQRTLEILAKKFNPDCVKEQRDGVVNPEIGHWYCGQNGNLFEVVAIDDLEGAIELQHFDGTLEEADLDAWVAMHAAAAEAPEDWTGSVDVSGEDRAITWQPPIRDWQSEVEVVDQTRSDITDEE
jgi:hypothetical protein